MPSRAVMQLPLHPIVTTAITLEAVITALRHHLVQAVRRLSPSPPQGRWMGRSPRPLKAVGYWWSPDEPHLPHPRDYVDQAWDPHERQRVVSYLRNAYVHRACMGMSWCRMGCPPHPGDIGTCDMTDGTWLFPEGLAHYVAHHSVKPPADFLEHMRMAEFRAPAATPVGTKPGGSRTL